MSYLSSRVERVGVHLSCPVAGGHHRGADLRVVDRGRLRVPATRPPSPFFVVIIKDPLLQQEPFARPYQLIFYTLRIDDRA
jgi:hypothetical protein